jgi:hypothetical protein
MALKKQDKKSSYLERMKRYGIQITIEDMYAPHIKHKKDKKQIIITHLGGRTKGNWTTFDLDRILEIWDEFLKSKEYNFKIKESERQGLKRLEEERHASTEETFCIWRDKQKGREWLEFQKKNK